MVEVHHIKWAISLNLLTKKSSADDYNRSLRYSIPMKLDFAPKNRPGYPKYPQIYCPPRKPRSRFGLELAAALEALASFDQTEQTF